MAPSTVTIEQLSGVSSSSSSRILLVNWHGKSLQNGKSRRLIVKVILAKSTTKPYSLPVDRQLRIHCSLRAHRNIHTAMDWFIDWNHRALVFISELANGGDFSRYLERRRTLGRPVSTFTCTSFADQLIAGIAHLHRHGILHRDIKPNNLLLFREDRRLNTRRGPKYRLQIADFGIARHLPSGSTLTASSVGTPRYLSPEQVRGDAYGLAADIWMAGLVLAELLTLQRPPPAWGVGQSARRRIVDSIVVTEGSVDSHRVALGRLVWCILDPDPSKRPSADGLLEFSVLKSWRGVVLDMGWDQ